MKKLLDSIGEELEFCDRHDFETLIVDDCTPGGQEMLDNFKEKYPWAIFFRNCKNEGPAFSRNFGVEKSSKKWIWFLDSDVYLAKGSIRSMLALLSEHPNYFCFVSGVGPNSVSNKSFQKYKNYIEYSWQPPDGKTCTVDSKSFLIMKAIFKQVGGFQSKFNLPNVEDYDLGYKLLEKNIPIYFTHRVKIYHHHPCFFKQFKLFFQRSRDWMKLKSIYGYFSDDFGTTKSEALLQLVNIGILSNVFFVFISPYFLIILTILLMVSMLLNRKVLWIMIKKKESLLFFVRFFLYSLILAIPVCLGALVGLAQNIKNSL